MADTTETKKKTRSSNKSKKKNYDPKWKTKKEAKKTGSTKVTSKTKTPVKKSNSINKKEGKKIDKEKIVDKYNIENTVEINIPALKESASKEEKETNNKVVTNSNPKVKHFNFIARVCTLVAMILLFLSMCLFFTFKAIGYELGESTTYSEYTSNNYSVCTKEIGFYENNCVGKDLDYISSIINNIHATFNYEAVYSKNITIDSNYYVIGRLNIFSEDNKSHIRYTKEDTFIDSTELKLKDDVVSFSTNVDIDFNMYKAFVQEYITKTGVSSGAELEVSLYLESDGVSRKISYINIPLTEETFMITSSNLDNQNQLVVFNDKNKTTDPFYMFIAAICLFMDVLLFTYLVNLIYMIYHLDNEYNKELKRILKEYDNIIVNATSDYIIPEGSRVIEVSSFRELLDARTSIERPIVYERINNIKSKFYLEDGNTIYLYKMKDEGR